MGSSGGSGKDTVADMIQSLNDGYTLKTSLSSGIYDICNTLGEKGRPERYELQAVGEQMRRIFGEMVWIKQTDSIISKTKDKEPLDCVVIPDIRKLLEYSHYCIERHYAPLYVYVDQDTARERLLARDGGFDEKDLRRTIETQMHFVETLPMEKVIDGYGLKKVVNSGCFNDIYLIDNSGDIETTGAQVKKWWELINE